MRMASVMVVGPNQRVAIVELKKTSKVSAGPNRRGLRAEFLCRWLLVSSVVVVSRFFLIFCIQRQPRDVSGFVFLHLSSYLHAGLL